jgi:hypothetical protein
MESIIVPLLGLEYDLFSMTLNILAETYLLITMKTNLQFIPKS